MPNELWFIIYDSTGLVLPKQILNHTHITIGDMRASELACLNSNYISCLVEFINACALYNNKTRARYITIKHVHII